MEPWVDRFEPWPGFVDEVHHPYRRRRGRPRGLGPGRTFKFIEIAVFVAMYRRGYGVTWDKASFEAEKHFDLSRKSIYEALQYVRRNAADLLRQIEADPPLRI